MKDAYYLLLYMNPDFLKGKPCMYKSDLPEYEQIIIMVCLAMIPVIVATGRTFRPAYKQFCFAFLTTKIVL